MNVHENARLAPHRQLALFELVQVPYGQSRPIDFDRCHFYAEHLDDDELQRFFSCIGSTLRSPAFALRHQVLRDASSSNLPRKGCRTHPENIGILRRMDFLLYKASVAVVIGPEVGRRRVVDCNDAARP
jgi:hypothetical protein